MMDNLQDELTKLKTEIDAKELKTNDINHSIDYPNFYSRKFEFPFKEGRMRKSIMGKRISNTKSFQNNY